MSVIIRPLAQQDLLAIFQYYAREAGMRVADRFFVEAEATFAELARMPRIGKPYNPEESLLADLRFFPVSRYRDYMVFYRPAANGIEVYRMLHRARDIAEILAEEFNINDDTNIEN